MPLPLPPPEQPDLFDVDRPASPTEDEESPAATYEGIELTVYGLEHKNPQSAAEHLRKIVNESESRNNSSPEVKNMFRALQVRPAGTRGTLDYAYLSFDQDAVPQPRADLLQTIRKILLEDHPTIRVQWRTHPGPDRTRRLTFALDARSQAQEIARKLETWMDRRGFKVMTSFSSRGSGTSRITYDFFDPAHVDAIFASPPVIDGRTYYPTRPRFIIPSFGYQVAFLGCRDWQSAKNTLDHFVRGICTREDGLDPIVLSRMELEGDVYTAVLRDWVSAVKVAESATALCDFLSAHPTGRYISPIPQPGLLYGLNGSGLFLRQGLTERERPSVELQQLRHELDAVRQQGVEQIQTLFSSLSRTNEAIAAMGTRLDHSLAAMTSLASQHTLDAQILQLELSASDLRQERHQCEVMLLLGDRVPQELLERNLVRMRECEEELVERQRQITELRRQRGAIAFSTATAIGPPSPIHAANDGSQPVAQATPATASSSERMGFPAPNDSNMDISTS